MAQAAGVSVCRSSKARFASQLVESFRTNTIKIILALVRRVGAERGVAVADTEMRLTSVRSCFLTAGYIPLIGYADLQKEFTKKPSKYERNVQGVFATDRVTSSGDGEYFCASFWR